MSKNQDVGREDLPEEESQEHVDAEQDDDGEFVKIPKSDFENLKKNLAKANKSDERRRRELEKYAAFGTPDEIEASLASVGESSGGFDDEALQKKLEKQRKELERKYQADLEAERSKIASMESKIQETVLLGQARETITKYEGAPDLLLDVVRKATKVVEQDGGYKVTVVDEDGDPRFNNRGEYMTLDDFVQDLRNHDTYGLAFKAPKRQGAGVQNQGGSAKKADPTVGLRKSQMTMNERQDFIAKHGFAKYKEIEN